MLCSRVTNKCITSNLISFNQYNRFPCNKLPRKIKMYMMSVPIEKKIILKRRFPSNNTCFLAIIRLFSSGNMYVYRFNLNETCSFSTIRVPFQQYLFPFINAYSFQKSYNCQQKMFSFINACFLSFFIILKIHTFSPFNNARSFRKRVLPASDSCSYNNMLFLSTIPPLQQCMLLSKR